MENKKIICIIAIFIIFVMLIFTTPFIDNQNASLIWMFFFVIIFLILFILVIMQFIKSPKGDFIENFKKQHIIIKILLVASIISLICNIITFKYYEVTIILFGILTLIEIFGNLRKKEE